MRADPEARLLRVRVLLLTLPFLTVVPVPRRCSSLALWVEQNLDIFNVLLLIAFGL